MGHSLYLIRNPEQIAAFSGLVLPEVFPRLEEQSFYLVGAVEGNMPVGAAVLELKQGRAQLHSIAAAADHRRQGIGSALLRQCVRVLRRTSIQTLYTVLPPEETEAEALLSAFGMEPSDNGETYYRFTLDAAAKLDTLRGPVHKAIPLEEASSMLFRDYIRKAFPADPSVGKREQFDPKLSQVFLEDKGITACLLVEREQQGFSIGWLSSRSRDKLAPLYLLRGTLAAAVSSFPPEAVVDFAAFDPAVVRLADKLVGEAAEKIPLRQWKLEGYRFRLTDTTPKGWEENQNGV